jgi:hypothetical protein
VVIPVENRPTQYLGYAHFTPVAAYEAAWDVVIFALLLGLTVLQQRRQQLLPTGSIFLAYLVLYSIGRIPLEGLRIDSLWVDSMRVAQIVSWLLIVVGILAYIGRMFSRSSTAPVLVQSAPLQPTQAYLIAATRANRSAGNPSTLPAGGQDARTNDAETTKTGQFSVAPWQQRPDMTRKLPRVSAGGQIDKSGQDIPPEETL